MKLRDYLILLLVLIVSFFLLFFNIWTSDLVFFQNLSKVVNKHLVYQPLTLSIAIVFMVVLWKTKKHEFLHHFRKGDISAEIIPAPWVGIKPKVKENWFHFGRNLGVSITLVTAAVIYFQVVGANEFDFRRFLQVLPVAFVFSIVNSFVEESVTRLGVVVALKGIVSDRYIMIISGSLFGILHYWGTPGGIVGVMVAGFLGWFLAKSILETKGFFWAWTIHFLQDVVIFSAMLMVE